MNDFNLFTVGLFLKFFQVRIADQIFALHFQRDRLPKEGRDLLDQPVELALKVGGVVDHTQMRMPCPCGDQEIINRDRLLRCLDPGPVVGQCIGLQCSFGRRREMEDRIVLVSLLDLAEPQLSHNIFKFNVIHIGLVVHHAAVTDDQYFFGIHLRGCPLKNLFFSLLQRNLAFLIFFIADQGPGRHSAGDQLCRRLRNKQNSIAPFGKLPLNLSHSGRFSCAGTAGNYYFGNLHIFLPLWPVPLSRARSP